LYPRFELINEFRRASEGQSLHILRFSTFLELFDVSAAVVAEVKQNEADDLEMTFRKLRGRARQAITAEHAVELWFVENDFEVLQAPSQPFDFIARRDNKSFFVSVKYCRSAQVMVRAELAETVATMLAAPLGPSDIPMLIVVPVDVELREPLAASISSAGSDRLQVRFGIIVDDAFVPDDNRVG
jgi:hypothetical protein